MGPKATTTNLVQLEISIFVVTREKLNQSSMLIIAGGNLFTESLEGFLILRQRKRSNGWGL